MSVERLTEEQARFAMVQMRRWLQLKFEHENGSVTERDGEKVVSRTVKRWSAEKLANDARYGIASTGQLIPDVDHSALLYRLLRGRDPLPEPPPLAHSYPVYPDWPYVDSA